MLNAIVTVIGAAVIGLVSWGAKLQSDVNVEEQKVVDLKELINTKLDNIDKRLYRIERSLNGRLRSEDGYSGYDHH